MTDLLLDTVLTLEQRDYAETIRHSGEALLTVIGHPRRSHPGETSRCNRLPLNIPIIMGATRARTSDQDFLANRNPS